MPAKKAASGVGAAKKSSVGAPLDLDALKLSVREARRLEERASLMRQDLLFLDVDDDGSGWPLFTPVELMHDKVEVVSHKDGVLTLRHRLHLEFVRIDDPDAPDHDEVEALFETLDEDEDDATLGWVQYQQRWWLPEPTQTPGLAVTLFALATARAQLVLSIHPFMNEIVRQLGRGSIGAPQVQSAEAKRQDLRRLLETVLKEG